MEIYKKVKNNVGADTHLAELGRLCNILFTLYVHLNTEKNSLETQTTLKKKWKEDRTEFSFKKALVVL